MKNIISIALVLLIGQQAISQVPEDALRMSWNVPQGTARQQAIGGAMGSLGGEITATFVNPAGLGFYKVSDFVVSPGLTLVNGYGDYRGLSTNSGNNFSRFNINTTGFVIATNDRESKWTSKAFSIAVSRTADFNGSVYYKGNNDYSSYSEQFSEELSKSGVSIAGVGSSPYLSLGTKMAVYTYLIDTATIGGKLQVIGKPEYLPSVFQENQITTKGGITELAIGFASNMEDKVYIGGSIGVPIVNYERRSVFTESDPTGNTNNNFGFSRYEEKYISKGAGVNAKLGVIFKPVQALRMGVAIHTPTIYGLKDQYSSKMVTNTENLFPNDPVDSVTSDYYLGNQPALYKYDLVTPWKFLVSGSYVFHEVEDVTKQRGFITADAEYVTYRSSRFSAAEQEDDDTYYKTVNSAVKSSYKGAFNFRVGGELKFNIIMARLGFAYYGNPYKDDALKAHKMNVSGGLGYRNKGIFIDLTYVQSLNKDVNFPYRLTDKSNTFADVKGRNANIYLTVGFKM